MALELTANTRRALSELSIEPNIAIRFQGLDVIFSAKPVQEYIEIDCLNINDNYIGGLKDLDPEKNRTLIDSKSSNFNIRQQINHDEGKSSSISSMNIGLVDKNEYITQLISPGVLLEDVLGRKVTVSVTYGSVSFFEDSITIFKGFTTNIDSLPGIVIFKINHPDNKKKVKLFSSVETGLTTAMNSIQTSLVADDSSTFLQPAGPLTTYIRIDDEVMQYTSSGATSFSGLTRGVLGTTASTHAAGAQIKAIYGLEDNPLDLALKLMMSGWGTDPVHSAIAISQFVQLGPSVNQVSNAIYFGQVNIPDEFGLRAGDTLNITGAINAGNNLTGAVVEDVILDPEFGYYVTIVGAAFTLELNSTAEMETFTQYNVFPEVGMRMAPDEVDIDEHIKIRDFFHSSTQMRFFLKDDDIDGKEFIESQLYRPIACYALPRKAQSSVGYTVGPIPGEDIQTLKLSNVKEPNRMKITRGVNRSFFNEIIYRYEDSILADEERFLRGDIIVSEDSKNRIPGNNREFLIDSLGLRTDLNAQNIIASNSQRLIDRYKYAAELVYGKALLRDMAGVEVGDIIVGEFDELHVSDITQGSRVFKPRLFEIQNRSLNLKTGNIDFVAMDTGLNLDSRFGLMSPCSPIAGLISPSQFVIGPDALYPSKYGLDEYLKWENIISVPQPISILIHNTDYSIQEDLVVTSISGNTFTLQTPATIALTVGLMVDFTGYADDDTSDKQKLVYAYMTDAATFPDGEGQYTMI